MAASFRASTLCPDARAPPRFGAFWSPGALLRNLWPSTRERSPGFTASLLPNRAIRHNLGASATVWFPLPVTAGGFHMVGSLATLSPRPYPPVQPLGLQLSFFAFWPTAPSLAGTHCQSATSPVGLRRGLDFNQLEAGITLRHPPLLFKKGKLQNL